MTADDLSSPPEGKLIRSARERAIPKLSIREAAAKIGISPEHWGNVERGYKSVGARGEPRRLDVSAALVAKMARAVDVSPELLETEGERPDAAAELRDMIRDGVPLVPSAHARPSRREIDFGGSDPEALHPFKQAVLREVYKAVGLGSRFSIGDVPELDAFPGIEETLAILPARRQPFRSPQHEKDAWDTEGLLLNERITLIARMRLLWAQADEAESRQTGLTPYQDTATGRIPVLVSVAGKALRASS